MQGNVVMHGKVSGNFVQTVDGNLKDFDGCEVIITILNQKYKKLKEPTLDLNQFVTPYDRGMNPDEYVRRLRDNDRL